MGLLIVKRIYSGPNESQILSEAAYVLPMIAGANVLLVFAMKKERVRDTLPVSNGGYLFRSEVLCVYRRRGEVPLLWVLDFQGVSPGPLSTATVRFRSRVGG